MDFAQSGRLKEEITVKKTNLLVLFTLLVGMIVLSDSANAASGRRFYLTKNVADGAHALEACASGYHMASLWEMYDVSNLRYDRILGFVQTDSGFGPPSGAFGWVRTGAHADVAQTGLANCNVWTSNDPSYQGTLIELPVSWDDLEFETQIGSWIAGTGDCGSEVPVWCVQN
jgi:hypothetical protein